MIINFEFSNFKSFKNAQYFSMRRAEGAESASEDNDYFRKDTVHVAAFYGANAAGKTSVLEALEALCSKAIHFEPQEKQFNNGYQFANQDSTDTQFLIDFVTRHNKVQFRYRYEISYNGKRIKHESLSFYKSSRATTIFLRQHNSKKHEGELKKIDKGFSKEQRSAIPYFLETHPNASLLSFLNSKKQKTNQHITNAFNFFDADISSCPILQTDLIISTIPKLIKEQKSANAWLNMVLPVADFGITGVGTVEASDDEGLSKAQKEVLLDAVRRAIKIKEPNITDKELDERVGSMADNELRMFFSHNIDGKLTKFSPNQESRGTLAATAILIGLLPILKRGGVLVVDELDCSLHPMLVAQIIGVFNNPKTNPYGAQLIFTTHDTSLLDKTIYGEDILTRDEVWFVEKNEEGISTLYPLRSIKNTTRKEDNIYRKYVEGRYGAIPKTSIASYVEAYWMEYKENGESHNAQRS